MDSQAKHALLSMLPPGPWHARGNEVRAGDKLVAVVFCRNASLVAQHLSKFPETLDAPSEEDFDLLATENEELKREIEKLEKQVEDTCGND
jgi:hypothetical protein